MATVLDASRPADVLVKCATDVFTQPTPRKAQMQHGFTVQKSELDTHIPNLSVSVTPVNNTADGAGTPIVDDKQPPLFFLPSTPDQGGGGGTPAPTANFDVVVTSVVVPGVSTQGVLTVNGAVGGATAAVVTVTGLASAGAAIVGLTPVNIAAGDTAAQIATKIAAMLDDKKDAEETVQINAVAAANVVTINELGDNNIDPGLAVTVTAV